MLTRVTRAETTTITLPGRTLQAYLRAGDGTSNRISVHTATFPPGSKPDGHVHASEEEAIYVLSGRGRIVTPDRVAELEPGVFVLIHPGTFHATETGDAEGLELLCIFSPPVVLGSYEHAEVPSEP
jgi:quercetin dioxygenase-like cupin family protein